ncbi:MAG TPA: hypothetical protein VGO17_10160 [Aurantimonas sp.]|jgi:hypothetical protein|nr:hypothetical protein [Aurantimonas sp.]
MRKVLFSAAAVAAAITFSADAQARTFKKDVDERGSKCYLVEYVPSLYQYNTRGKLVTGESRTWVGDITEGAIISKRRNPSVYIQTKKLVEKDHYTLVPQGSC